MVDLGLEFRFFEQYFRLIMYFFLIMLTLFEQVFLVKQKGSIVCVNIIKNYKSFVFIGYLQSVKLRFEYIRIGNLGQNIFR